MYKLLEVRDAVRVPPKEFDEDLKEAIKSEFGEAFIGRTDKGRGVILAVISVRDIGEGEIIMGDGAIYYDATFEILVYKPVLNEVVEGIITEMMEFGAFVNFGPLDGLIHVSQITEDFMSYDQKNSLLVGKESRKIIKPGDKVRARIVAISLKSKFGESKIGLTMRQPYLGKIEWLEEEKKKQEEKKKKLKGEDKKKQEEKKKPKKEDKKKPKLKNEKSL